MYLQRVAGRKIAGSAGQRLLLSNARLTTAGGVVITFRLFPNTGLHARGLRGIGIIAGGPLICQYGQSSHRQAGVLHVLDKPTGVTQTALASSVGLFLNVMRLGKRGPASSAARQCHVSMADLASRLV